MPTSEPMMTDDDTAGENDLLALEMAQRLPQSRVDLARILGGMPHLSDVARTEPLTVSVGDVQEFWVTNLSTDENVRVTAELRYAGPVVLMYVEQGMVVDQAVLEAEAQAFEQRIYPRTRALFGSEWQPGVDGDPRITILHTYSRGDNTGGYFSPRDSVPQQVNRFSNEREMFYMKILPGSASYLSILAHEFQHMIHWNVQRRSAAWFNEGCATLSQDLNGFGSNTFISPYLNDPDIQLTDWVSSAPESYAHYGAANLFLRYLYLHYVGEDGLQPLLQANASNDLDVFATFAARHRPDIGHFHTLFGDWMVANLLNDPTVADGRYAYPPSHDAAQDTTIPPLPYTVRPQRVEGGEADGTVHQFGADYLDLPAGPLTLTFTGAVSANLVWAAPQGTFAWWSGRSDNSVATLTRAFDLSGFDTAYLRFTMWYELETEYDYAFVTVSTDGGTNWHTLAGNHTTNADTQGANYGNGITGVSGQTGTNTDERVRGVWVEETMDLTPYAGQKVIVRFWQVNDESINRAGLLLDNVRICRTEHERDCAFDDDVEGGPNDWQAEGFVRVDSDLPQRWELRLVRTASNGTVTVEPLPVGADGQAHATLASGERGVLVVAAVTPYTTELADYHLLITQ